jgi:prepilin-type N-terminal cleavage/methylation domain-containing protein
MTNARTMPAGFTLMELMLVMLVVSVVLAITAPSLRGFFASRQTADAALSMASLTKWARSQAISRGRCCRLNVDPASGTYWLTVQQGGMFSELHTDLGRRRRLPEGASVRVRNDGADPSLTYVQFFPTGRSDPASIEIRGRQGELYQLVSASATEPFRVISPSEAP